MEEEAKPKALFDQCSFIIIKSATLDDEAAAKLIEALKLHGGDFVVDESSHASRNLTGVTHVISSTSDFPGYDTTTDALIPVVRPSWIETSLAKNRLSHTRQFSPDPRMFMSDVVICCADLPEGDADAIAGGVIAMGGNYANKVTVLCTHVVALTMENDMCDLVATRGLNIKIVLPHWFDDCLKVGRKIDETPYLLPDPEILQIEHTMPPPGAQRNGQVSGALHPHPGHDTPSLSKRGPIVAFKDKKIMLSDDLGIAQHLRQILVCLIECSGGDVVDKVKSADIFVCKYRDGNDYKKASRAGIEVGNLAWLYYLIMNDQWTSPTRRLLHYPISRKPLPGFENKKISLSNYSGEARTYLENLIKAAGAECTKTLRQENTHLVTAHDQSEKCAAARDWNVHMINHLWLEESYARWQMQSETTPRYTHFPKRTNLGEVVGQTQIDRKVLERFWADDDVELSDSSSTRPAITKQKVALAKKDQPASSPAPDKPKASRATKVRQLQDTKRNLSTETESEAEGLKTPSANRRVAAGKENVTPMTGSRRSKEAAAAKLHEMTPDIALYEKEKKRVGGVVYGGRRKPEDKDSKVSRKRSIDAVDTDDTDEADTKKVRHGQPPISIHLLISGYKKWYDNSKQETADISRLRELGIVVVVEPSKATYLAIPHVVRTAKAVVALSYAPVIISTDFIDACLENEKCLDPDDFKLKDEAAEKKLGLTLDVARKRAMENKNQLLQGRSVYVVEKIPGGFQSFQAIIEANGGLCMSYRGRRGTMVPSRRAGSESHADDDPQTEVYLLSSESQEDEKLWPHFTKMAEASRKVPRIVKTDWLLDSAMCQKLQPTTNYELYSDD